MQTPKTMFCEVTVRGETHCLGGEDPLSIVTYAEKRFGVKLDGYKPLRTAAELDPHHIGFFSAEPLVLDQRVA